MKALIRCSVEEPDFDPAARKAFDAVFGRHAMAWAKYMQDDQNNEEMLLAADKWRETIWELIRVRAVVAWQVAHKIRVLRSLMDDGGDWADKRQVALVDSILLDVECL